MHILALEASTTSAKALLYNTADHTHTIKTKPFPLYFNNPTLHDAENVFLETAALGKAISHGKPIDAIALSTTWHNIMLCDNELRPQTPVYLWSNVDASEICKQLREDESYTNTYYQKTGCMVNAIYPSFKLKKLRTSGYRLEDYQIIDEGTYIAHRLTGQQVVTDCCMSGTGFLNIKTKKLDRQILDENGVHESNFAQLIAYDKVFPLSKEGADFLGLTPGIPVLPACPDGALNQVGAGALNPSVMTLSVGTSGAVRIATPKPVLPKPPATWCYLAPGTWLSGAATSGCCNCVDWYKNKFFNHNATYSDLEAHFNDPFDTPVFLPFLFGERCPGWRDERKAGFFDIEAHHTQYDFYHSVLEGVLFNLYQSYRVLTAVNGDVQSVKLSGGIINSPYWLQMCSDIFELPMDVDDTAHSSLMGALALGLEHLGIIGSLREFKAKAQKTILPDPEKADAYKAKYARYLHHYNNT